METNRAQLIFSYLLQHGRQPIPRIVQNTDLSPRQVRHGLAVLVQQHLVFHCTSFDDGITYYESNWRSAYNLVKAGKIVQVVDERLGKHAARIMSALLALGHAKVSYLESLPELQPDHKSGNQTNGVDVTHEEINPERYDIDGEAKENSGQKNGYKSNGAVQESNDHPDAEDTLDVQTILHQLAAFGFIVRLRNQHFQSPEDNLEAALKVAKSNLDTHGLKGNKLEAKLVEDAEKLVKQWNDGTITRALPSATLLRGVKRRIGNNDSSAPRKRLKLDQPIQPKHESDDDQEGEELSEDDYDDDDMATLDVSVSSASVKHSGPLTISRKIWWYESTTRNSTSSLETRDWLS